MAQISGVYSGDTIEQAITSPMDWGKLEAIAYDVLVADDFPTLRKIGGIGDEGMDAVEEVFYDATRQVTTVIQVTSAQGQKTKVRDTIEKLKKNSIDAKRLVFLTRHPVTAGKRVEMIEEADAKGVTLEVRDQAYLVAQLSKNTTIFARHFADARAQFGALLEAHDPLHAASDKLQHALLATLGAYVLHDHSRLARGTLFDKTVLAALAAAKDGTTSRAELLSNVRKLLPPTEGLNQQQLDAAIDRLVKTGECSAKSDTVICSEAVLVRCLTAASRAEDGFKKLHDHILTECQKIKKFTDAAQGYLERNLRRAIVHLLRASGPLRSDDDQGLQFDPSAADEIRSVLYQDLEPEIAQSAIVAFSTFVRNPSLSPVLAPLVNSYAALAMRNLDPIGRRWQQMVLARSVIAIDTDVLLYLIVEELPEHPAILSALRSLQADGIEIVVPEHVFSEAIGHLERAPRTYRRFSDRLLRLPAEVVDARVWHAVVRGYYFARHSGYNGTFENFYGKYHLPSNPAGFAEHLISKRLSLKQRAMDEAPARDADALTSIGQTILQFREQSRRKATFRDPAGMAQRVREDVAMALTLAAKSDESIGASAKGYVASSDRAFRMIEGHHDWQPRKRVHVWSSALPQLSFFACGNTLSPNESVDLIFNPVTVAAADLMADQISLLATIGVDLKGVPLDRLDWDLRQNLGSQLDTLRTAVVAATTDNDPASATAALRLAQAASDAGYPVTAQVKTLVEEFDDTKGQLAEERIKRQQVEEQLRSLVVAMRQQSTSKARRRLNKLVEEIGVGLDDDLDEDPDTP